MSGEIPETDLIARAARGNRAAYGLLARQYGPALSALIRATGVHEAEVEDVAQEAFIAAWRALSDYDRDRPFRPWLYRIAINKARDWSRRRKVRAFFHRAADLEGEARNVAEHSASEGDQRSANRALRALAAAPADLREAFVLTAIAGLTQPEAASALGVTVKAIESRVLRARTLLQAAVEEF